jgi:serine/threonine protein kinase
MSSGNEVATDRPWIGAVNDEFGMYSYVYSCISTWPSRHTADRSPFVVVVVVNSDNPRHYTLGPPIGLGASSTVYAATYRCPGTGKDTEVALKVVDLDKLPQSALKLLTTETQLMSLSKHPNVLRVRGTWLDGRKLYIALRLMRAGSISDCMRYKFTAGIDEESARCILKQALEGLK